LNGVVTFVKRGAVTVLSANSEPFQDEELDSQGRCIMTDHGDFVVFNVYVPQGGSCGLGIKLKFLYTLRQCMNDQRTKHNKAVILVGDLNLSHEPEDVFWRYRQLNVEIIVEDVRNAKKAEKIIKGPETTNDDFSSGIAGTSMICIPKWKLELEKHWETIQQVLKTKKATPVQTQNSLTGAKFDKFNTSVKVDGKWVVLGKAQATQEEALAAFSIHGRYYQDPDTKLDKLARQRNVIDIDSLSELMAKIVNVEWSLPTLRLMAKESEVYHVSPTIHWMAKVIHQDNMVDAFRLNYPNAEGRFTCWNQHTNSRYTNEGARIDYTLVDSSLVQYVKQGRMLDCGELSSRNGDPFSEEAALHAATASGGYQAASFDGSGIGSASRDVLERQFGQPHTGMIYTPPNYSDHIAVTLFLSDKIMPVKRAFYPDRQDKVTRKTQPHMTQSSITSFFNKAASGAMNIVKSSSKTKSSLSTVTICSEIAVVHSQDSLDDSCSIKTTEETVQQSHPAPIQASELQIQNCPTASTTVSECITIQTDAETEVETIFSDMANVNEEGEFPAPKRQRNTVKFISPKNYENKGPMDAWMKKAQIMSPKGKRKLEER